MTAESSVSPVQGGTVFSKSVVYNSFDLKVDHAPIPPYLIIVLGGGRGGNTEMGGRGREGKILTA